MTEQPEAPREPASLADAVAAAARRSGLAPAADSGPLTGQTLLGAMGGVRGIAEAVVPGLVFLVVYSLLRDLVLALVLAVASGLIFTVLRLLQREPLVQAVAGLVGVAASAALALFSGRGEDFFLLGFWTNAAYAAVLLLSVLVRWPLIGLAVGYLMGDGTAWRRNPFRRRALTGLTLVWVLLFVARLAVQVPLYLTGAVEALGATRLLMGVPLYAPLLVLTWLVARALYRPVPAEATGGAGDEHRAG